jgi:NADH-quinone oxidoreductase subunit N
MSADIFPLVPALLLMVAGLLYIFPGMLIENRRIFGYLSIGVLIIATILTLLTFNAYVKYTSYLSGLSVSPFSQFFSLVFLTVSLFVCIASLNSIKRNEDEYYFLILLSTLGMMVVAMSEDLIILFIGFELASLATYALAGFEKKSELSVEAAIKYFIFGGFSSALMLYGISLIYGFAGGVEIERIVNVAGNNFYSMLGLVLIVAGIGFKSALVPFHMWAPDTYHGSPTMVSAFLASGSKKMSFAAFFKILILMAISMKLEMYLLMAVLAVVTMTLGNLSALVQESVKRMLAYSSIAHAGYIAMAYAIFAFSGIEMAIAGGLLHVVSHAIATVGAFVAVAYVGGFILDRQESYFGLGRRSPLMALSFSVILLSLAGIPPTLGFYSKFVLFLTAIEAKLLWLAIVALINSALSLYYYSKVIMNMYWKETTSKFESEFINIKEKTILLVVVISAVLLIVLGVVASPLTEWSITASKTIFGQKMLAGV